MPVSSSSDLLKVFGSDLVRKVDNYPQLPSMALLFSCLCFLSPESRSLLVGRYAGS
ncbi:hypothetical protein ACOSQ4_023189 [Xanthoceras sorbifolium]